MEEGFILAYRSRGCCTSWWGKDELCLDVHGTPAFCYLQRTISFKKLVMKFYVLFALNMLKWLFQEKIS